jgi:hypothetical protein
MAWATLTLKDANGVNRTILVWDEGGIYTQATVRVTPAPAVLGFEKRTISTSAASITATTIPSGSTHALVTLEGGDCRYRDDASAASVTGTDGLLMIAGQEFEFTNLSALRFIRASYETADVTLQVSYRKYVT